MEKSEIRNIIGKRIILLRKRNGLTQTQFALMAGVNRSYLAGIEHGRRNFSIGTLVRIINALDTTFEEFFAGI